MTIYLTIITTLLVVTQIIRVIQNTLQLRHIRKEAEKNIKWIEDRDISEFDFDTQRECFYLLKEYLENKLEEQENDRNINKM